MRAPRLGVTLVRSRIAYPLARFQGFQEGLDSGMARDTTREAAQAQLAALRQLSASARLSQALELSDSVRDLFEAGRAARLGSTGLQNVLQVADQTP